MINIIKNYKWVIASSLICIVFGLLTFFTFINRSFINLNDLNLQILLIIDLVLLILIGLFGSIANLLLTKSYQLAEISLTTPLKYLSLFFAIIFGFYLFNEIPTIYTLSGAGLIVISSAIIFVREHQLKKPITLPRQQ